MDSEIIPCIVCKCLWGEAKNDFWRQEYELVKEG